MMVGAGDGRGGGEKHLASGYILKAKPMSFSDGMERKDVKWKRKAETQGDSKVLTRPCARMELLSPEVGILQV